MKKDIVIVLSLLLIVSGGAFVMASKGGDHTPPYNGSPIENSTTPFPIQNMTQNKTEIHNNTMIMNETQKHKHGHEMEKCELTSMNMSKEELQIIEQYNSLLMTEKMVIERKMFEDKVKMFALRVQLMTATRNSGEEKNLTEQIREEIMNTEKEMTMYSLLLREVEKQMSIVSRIEYAGMFASVSMNASVEKNGSGINGSVEISTPFPRIMPVIPPVEPKIPATSDVNQIEAMKLQLALELVNKATNNYTKMIGEYLAKSTAMEIEKFNISVNEQVKAEIQTAMMFNVSENEVEAIVHNCPEMKHEPMPIIPEPMPIIMPVIPPVLPGIDNILNVVGIGHFHIFVPKVAV